MKLGTRIFVANFLIFVLCFSYPVYWTRSTLRLRYLESVEDPLVDQANILAAIVGNEMEAGRFSSEQLFKTFETMRRRPLAAKIYRQRKKSVDMEVYITDKRGRVVFDSQDKSRVGSDYSAWRDVKLTLEGGYGARTTRRISKDPSSTVLYVAAPIMVKDKIEGTLTVAKPTTSTNKFLQQARPRLAKVFGISAAAAAFLIFFVSYWMTAPIRRLTRYANDVRQGKRVALPKLNRSEIGGMGHAFERMRRALEGKKYVEEYVHTLNHEIKSPLSAIRAAAELLGEKMEPERRRRFLANILVETIRAQELVDKMLSCRCWKAWKSSKGRKGSIFLCSSRTFSRRNGPC